MPTTAWKATNHLLAYMVSISPQIVPPSSTLNPIRNPHLLGSMRINNPPNRRTSPPPPPSSHPSASYIPSKPFTLRTKRASFRIHRQQRRPSKLPHLPFIIRRPPPQSWPPRPSTTCNRPIPVPIRPSIPSTRTVRPANRRSPPDTHPTRRH